MTSWTSFRAFSPRWYAALVAVFAAAAVLRVAPLAGEAFDGDELFSRNVAVTNPAVAAKLVRWDVVHPPLYYVLLRGVVAVGGAGPLGLRALSLLCGVLTIALTVVLARSVFGDLRIAVLAGALVALCDRQVFFSQQARSYALYSVLTLGMLLAWWRATRSPERRRPWVVFGAAAAAVVLTHYVGWLYVLATLPPLLLIGRRHLGRWLTAVTPAGLLFLGWIAFVYPLYVEKRGLGANLSWIGKPSPHGLAELFARFNGIPDIRGGTTLTLLVAAVAGAALAAVAVAMLRAARTGPAGAEPGPGSPRETSRRAAAGLALIASVALLPPVILFAITYLPVSVSIWGDRHVLPSQAGWAILMSVGAVQLARYRAAGAVLAAALLVLQLAGTAHIMQYPSRFPIPKVAAFIEAERRPEQEVFVSTIQLADLVGYYLGGRVRVKVLPREPGARTLPPTFWLTYRPWVPAERAALSAVERGGWRVVREQRFVRHAGDGYGVSVALLDRESGVATGVSPRGGLGTDVARR